MTSQCIKATRMGRSLRSMQRSTRMRLACLDFTRSLATLGLTLTARAYEDA